MVVSRSGIAEKGIGGHLGVKRGGKSGWYDAVLSEEVPRNSLTSSGRAIPATMPLQLVGLKGAGDALCGCDPSSWYVPEYGSM